MIYLLIASIIQPQSSGLPSVIKLEPNSGSYYCNTYSPTDDPNGPLALSIPVTNLASNTGTSLMTSTGHNTHQTISHTVSNSSPGSNGQHNSKRQRRLNSTDDSDKNSSDLQYYAHSWPTQDLDQLPQHMHMSPHVKIKQEVLHVGHYCSQSPKELSSKSLTDSQNRESMATLILHYITVDSSNHILK